MVSVTQLNVIYVALNHNKSRLKTPNNQIANVKTQQSDRSLMSMSTLATVERKNLLLTGRNLRHSQT